MKTRGTLGDKDPLNKVPSPRAKVVPLNGVSLIPPRILCTEGWKILMLESLQEINADPNCSTLNPLKTLLPNYEILQPNAITSKLIRTCAPTFALASKPENQKPHLDDHLQGKGFRPVESYEKKPPHVSPYCLWTLGDMYCSRLKIKPQDPTVLKALSDARAQSGRIRNPPLVQR